MYKWGSYARLCIKIMLVVTGVMILKLYVDVSCSLTVWQYVWHRIITEQYIMSHMKQRSLVKMFAILLLFQENVFNLWLISVKNNLSMCWDDKSGTQLCVPEYCQSQAAAEVKNIIMFNGEKKAYCPKANQRGRTVNCRLPVKNIESQRGYPNWRLGTHLCV